MDERLQAGEDTLLVPQVGDRRDRDPLRRSGRPGARARASSSPLLLAARQALKDRRRLVGL